MLIILVFLIGSGIHYYNQETASVAPPSTEYKHPVASQTPTKLYTLSFTTINLQSLAQGHYEGWILDTSNNPHSTGKFTVDEHNNLLYLDGSDFIPRIPSSVSNNNFAKYIVTIEPDGDTDSTPTKAIILAGDFIRGQARLSFAPADLNTAKGFVILGTPTDGPENELSGIWFSETNGRLPSLGLPILSEGWVYEGWLEYNGTYVSTGRFSDPTKPDLFNGYSETIAPAPLFPGEDFLINSPSEDLTFPIIISDEGNVSNIYVSIEPDDNGTDPTGDAMSNFIPLSITVPVGTPDHEKIFFDKNLIELPSAMININ